MKTMSCKQLGGACNLQFRADTFEEIANMSKEHGMKMFRAGDQAHLQAMEEMKALMTDPDAMRKWYEDKRTVFNNLRDDPEE